MNAMTEPVLDARQAHVMKRAWQRYAIELGAPQIDDIEAQCRDGRAVLLGRYPDGSERRLVMVGSRCLIACWLPHRRKVVTILPARLDGVRTRLRKIAAQLRELGKPR